MTQSGITRSWTSIGRTILVAVLSAGSPVAMAQTITVPPPGTAQTITLAPFALTEGPRPLFGGPSRVTAGPDGNVWFTQPSLHQIGRITPAGVITRFSIPAPDAQPGFITAGADGNLWFTEFFGNQIGRITPAGAISLFPIPTSASEPRGITAGPDGNVWFVETAGNNIGRITPAGAITEFTIPTPNSGPVGITTGPDGNLWFTESGANQIGRISPTGVITEFPVPTPRVVPQIIALGPDGNLWFTEDVCDPRCTAALGRITPGGVFSEFRLVTFFSALNDLTRGPDGALWFTELRYIGRITPAGDVLQFPVTEGTNLRGITLGPDGHLWFAEGGANRLTRITLGGPLSLSPPSGTYVATQSFDVALVLGAGAEATSGQATFNGGDVTALLVGCLMSGTLLTGGRTLRCPNVTGRTMGPGRHVFGVILNLTDATSASSGVIWDVLANTEP